MNSEAFKYSFKAHPTKYNGVVFRSRLEATWAYFFDLCKLKWLYEPVDFEGWVPDLVLHNDCRYLEDNYFIEVKPVFNYQEAFPILKNISKKAEKVLVCGVGGLIYDYKDLSYDPSLPQADDFTIPDRFRRVLFSSFKNRLWFGPEDWPKEDFEEHFKYWNVASNKTQWNRE